MTIDDLVKNFKNETLEKFRQKLNEFIRQNPNYSNLNDNSKEVIMKVISERAEKIRDGRGLSYENIRDEMHHIGQNQNKLKLSDKDLHDIKEILEKFKK